MSERFECPIEVACVVIADFVGYFADLQDGILQQMHGLVNPQLVQEMRERHVGLFTDTARQVRFAEVELLAERFPCDVFLEIILYEFHNILRLINV